MDCSRGNAWATASLSLVLAVRMVDLRVISKGLVLGLDESRSTRASGVARSDNPCRENLSMNGTPRCEYVMSKTNPEE